jgi:hypothetical protein
MQVFEKIGDEIILVYNPREKEEVEVGENLRILDKARGRGVIVQVIEENLVDLPGILEDLVRRESLTHVKVTEHAPSATEKYIMDVKNMKFARTKIRKELYIDENGEKLADWTGWVPDRSALVTVVDDDWIFEKLGVGKKFYKHPILLGDTSYSRRQLISSAYHFQGITLIVGKKGTGKSHLAKAILLGLIDQGARGIVFDINDEYSAMQYNEDGTKSPYFNKIIRLDPGENLRFTLEYVGPEVFYDVMETIGVKEASAIELRNIWERLASAEQLTFSQLQAESDKVSNAHIRDALTRRLQRLARTQLFTDDLEAAVKLEDELEKLSNGGALVVNLKAKDKVTCDIVVQTILSKLQELLEQGAQPIFIFAEEAHLYLREVNWAEAVTRMRHLGTYQLYMTNTPTEIRPLVIRQADNLFLFHLTEQQDLQHVSPAAKIDSETVTMVAKALPLRRCIVVGEATKHYPFVIDVKRLPVQTAGKTRLYFTEQ